MYHSKTEDYKLALPYPIATTDVPPETFYYTKNENGLTVRGRDQGSAVPGGSGAVRGRAGLAAAT